MASAAVSVNKFSYLVHYMASQILVWYNRAARLGLGTCGDTVTKNCCLQQHRQLLVSLKFLENMTAFSLSARLVYKPNI